MHASPVLPFIPIVRVNRTPLRLILYLILVPTFTYLLFKHGCGFDCRPQSPVLLAEVKPKTLPRTRRQSRLMICRYPKFRAHQYGTRHFGVLMGILHQILTSVKFKLHFCRNVPFLPTPVICLTCSRLRHTQENWKHS